MTFFGRKDEIWFLFGHIIIRNAIQMYIISSSIQEIHFFLTMSDWKSGGLGLTSFCVYAWSGWPHPLKIGLETSQRVTPALYVNYNQVVKGNWLRITIEGCGLNTGRPSNILTSVGKKINSTISVGVMMTLVKVNTMRKDCLNLYYLRLLLVLLWLI